VAWGFVSVQHGVVSGAAALELSITDL